MAEPPDEVVDELYGLPLAEFTPRRDALAKEIRKADRATADAVKKLRKPTVAAWAVNQLSRAAEDELSGLLAAGQALRQAQLGGGGDAVAVRSAARDEREAVEALVARAEELLGSASAATLEDVRQTLHAAAADEGVRALVERGRLTEPAQSVGIFGAFAPAPARPPAGEAAEPAEKPAKPSRKAAAKPSRKSDDDAAARKRAAAEAKERQKRARTALRDAERAARERARAVEDAERARDAAQAALEDAERELDRARRAADDAAAEVEQRRAELEQAEG